MNKKDWQSLRVGHYIVDEDGICRIIEITPYSVDVIDIRTQEIYTIVNPSRWRFPNELDKVKIL